MRLMQEQCLRLKVTLITNLLKEIIMEEKFISQLKEILEIEDRELKTTDIFRDFEEWDSLANLSVIAMIDEEYNVVIDNTEFKNLKTIGEVIEAIKKRI